MDIEVERIKSDLREELRQLVQDSKKQLYTELRALNHERINQQNKIKEELGKLNGRGEERMMMKSNIEPMGEKQFRKKLEENEFQIFRLQKQVKEVQREMELGQAMQAKLERYQKEVFHQLEKMREKVERGGLGHYQEKSLIDPYSKNYNLFKIRGSTTEMKETTKSDCQLISNIPITDKVTTHFTIERTYRRAIYFGIVAYDHLKDNNSLFEARRKQCIAFCAWKGDIFAGGDWKNRGRGIEEGETVVMTVSADKITWTVRGQIRNQYTDPIISDHSIKWVPFIICYDEGDRIKWQ